MKKTAALVLCVVFAFPLSAFANCSVMSSAQTALVDAGVDLSLTESLSGAWQIESSLHVDCSDEGTSCNTSSMKWYGDVSLVFANAEDVAVSFNKVGCTWSPERAAVGDGTCLMTNVRGVHLKARAFGGCSESGGATSMTDSVFSPQELLVPPGVPTEENTVFYVSSRTIRVDDVRVGDVFRFRSYDVWPAGDDEVLFRVEGAGMHITRRYGAMLNGDGEPQSRAAAWLQDSDASADAVITEAGDFQFWVELNGVRSEVRTFHAQQPMEASGGGAGGGGGSPAPGPSGCQTTGVGCAVLLAVALLRSRKMPL